MATRLKAVDAVLLGAGLVGTILGRELTRAGLSVVGLERGEPRDTMPDFQGPGMHDELRYAMRYALMQDTAKETLTAGGAATGGAQVQGSGAVQGKGTSAAQEQGAGAAATGGSAPPPASQPATPR